MNEEIELILSIAKEKMNNALEHLAKELRTIRAGKATPGMLENIMIDYYGSRTPLNQIANISTPDSRTLNIQPWEKNMLQEIEKAIQVSNLGFNPMNNGDVIIINIPVLTEERRTSLAKQVKTKSENAKIGVRNSRKEANNDIKKIDTSDDMKKVAEEEVQKLTDVYIKLIDERLSKKEKEIMTV